MTKYKSVLFDFDQTLVDTNKFTDEFTIQFLRENPYKGYGNDRFFSLVNGRDSEVDEEVSKLYWAKYKVEQIKKLKPFDDTLETLKWLSSHGIDLGIVSNSVRIRIETILNENKLLEYFKVIIGRDDAPENKPSAIPLLAAIQKLDFKKEDCLYVGDDQWDIETAVNAGVDVAFFTSYNTRETLGELKPTFTISSLSDLKRFV